MHFCCDIRWFAAKRECESRVYILILLEKKMPLLVVRRTRMFRIYSSFQNLKVTATAKRSRVSIYGPSCKKSSHFVHRAKFGYFSYCVRAYMRRSQKILGSLVPRSLEWGGGAWLTPGKMLLLYLCYRAIFGHFRSNHSSIIMETRQKKWPLTSHLPRSVKVTGTDTDRSATYDFLLVDR